MNSDQLDKLSYADQKDLVSKFNARFRKENQGKLSKWIKKYPGKPAPIIADKHGRMLWLNRRDQKLMERNARKNKNKKACNTDSSKLA